MTGVRANFSPSIAVAKSIAPMDFFLLFDQAANAVRFALAYHEQLAGLALSARVGIHAGPVTLRENAPHDIAQGAKQIEVEGLAKPLAARIMALARGGQTLMSAAARVALGDAANESAEIARHGHYRLKGIEEPVEIFELGVRDSSQFSPPTDVDKAYRVIRAGDFWRPVREVRHNLPAERDVFVGRIAELRALSARLDTGARLVTVLGPGGTGKTRFVLRFGRTWLGDWPGGVYFCDLSEARTRDGILFAVSSALGAPFGKDDPVVQLGHAIAGRGRSLVILDNFEQVVQDAPATLGLWLDRAPEAAFVVTSRERLQLPGEEIFPIEPLPLEMDAIELFATRARAQKPDFASGRLQSRRRRGDCAAPRRSAARHRTGGRAGARAFACADRRAHSRPIQVSRGRPRVGSPPSHAQRPRSIGHGTC